jgi:hypothetical protein
LTIAFKSICSLMVLSVLFWGACADAMAAQIGRSLPVSATWQRGSAVSVGQPCLPQGIQTIGPDATAAVSAKMPAKPSLRILYVLMLLRREQVIVANPPQLGDKLRAQIPGQGRRPHDCLRFKGFPEDNAIFRGN